MSGWVQGFMAFWWVCPILMLIMMLVGCFMMRKCFRMPGHGRDRRQSTETAEEILKKRFALGEIDRKSYDEMIDVIAPQRRQSEQ